MQAITTKLLPCTNTKPYRVKARCAAGSVTLSIDSLPENYHEAAARALMKKLGWDGYDLAEGGLHTGDTVFVLVPR